MTVDVGVDFGTTNCAIGYRSPASGRVTVLGPIPSIGAYSNGETVFGEEAVTRLRAGNRADHPLRDIKMALGGGALSAGRLPIEPVQAAAGLLRFVRSRIADIVPEGDVGMAVLGTPVRATAADRADLREAAQAAGFQDIRLVYEPTAALVGARSLATLGASGLSLVLDWGGGTLDVAVVRVQDGLFRELAVDGDRADLGGSRIDERLTRDLIAAHPHVRRAVEAFPSGLYRLMEEVEEQKIDILESLDPDDEDPRRILPPWLDAELWLTPEAVRKVLEEFSQRAAAQIEGMLSAAGIGRNSITQILFAGGTCKSDIVRREILRTFPSAEVLNHPSPQLLTADGCSRLTGLPFSVELAAHIAVREADDIISVLLEQGQAMELGAYRVFDYRVTDVNATEARFDFGILRPDSGTTTMRSGAADTFQSLTQLYVPVSSPTLPNGRTVPDRIRLYVGVDPNLTVLAHGEGNVERASAQVRMTGVPLAIRVPGP